MGWVIAGIVAAVIVVGLAVYAVVNVMAASRDS